MFPEDDKLMPWDIQPGADMTRGMWAYLIGGVAACCAAAVFVEVFLR